MCWSQKGVTCVGWRAAFAIPAMFLLCIESWNSDNEFLCVDIASYIALYFDKKLMLEWSFALLLIRVEVKVILQVVLCNEVRVGMVARAWGRLCTVASMSVARPPFPNRQLPPPDLPRGTPVRVLVAPARREPNSTWTDKARVCLGQRMVNFFRTGILIGGCSTTTAPRGSPAVPHPQTWPKRSSRGEW